VRGLRVGEESDVRICLVVIWRKIGSFEGDVEESSKRGFLSDLEAFGVEFICFNNASNAFSS
jgi:hypothetical protein